METRESGSLQERGFPGGSKVKSPPAKAEDSGDADSVPGWGRSPGGGNGNPLQYSCPWTEEPGRLLVHDVTESDPTESTQARPERKQILLAVHVLLAPSYFCCPLEYLGIWQMSAELVSDLWFPCWITESCDKVSKSLRVFISSSINKHLEKPDCISQIGLDCAAIANNPE